MNILVVASHPDDEVLGCGATMASLAGQGHKVHVSILGEGVTSRYADRSQAPASELQALEAAARQAGDLLNVEEVRLHGLPDNRFDTLPLLEVVKLVEGEVLRVKPRVLFVQHGGDLNVDHQVTFKAALTACRPMEGSPVEEFLAFEVPSSTEWSFGCFSPPFAPDTYVDVGQTLERKLEALKAYEPECRAFPHPRSPEAVGGLARMRGTAVGYPAAEAFQTIYRRVLASSFANQAGE